MSESSQDWRSKRGHIGRALWPPGKPQLPDWLTQSRQAARTLRNRHDLFTTLLVIGLMLLAIGTCPLLIRYLQANAHVPPDVQSIGDMRLNADYRDPAAPFTAMTRLGDRLVLASAGNGLQVYETASGDAGVWQTLTTQNTQGGLPSNRVDDVTTMNDQVWVAAGGGLVRTDLQQWQSLIPATGFHPLNIDRDVTAVQQTPDGQALFIGTRQYGLGEYNVRTHEWRAFAADSPDPALSSNTVNALTIGANHLWVGTSNGLNVFGLSVTSPQVITRRRSDLEIPERDIVEIRVDGDRAWARTGLGGVLTLRDWTGTPVQPPSWQTLIGDGGFPALALRPQQLSQVAAWNEQLWVSTDGSGIGRYDTLTHDWKVYTASTGLSSNAVSALVIYSNTLWAATRAGIDVYDAQQDRWAAAGPSRDDIARLKELNGDLWYVTAQGDVGVWRGQGERWQNIIGPGAMTSVSAQPTIRALAVYSGALWVGLPEVGVAAYDPVQHSWQTRNSGLPTPESIEELKVMNGTLWARARGANSSNRVAYQWRDTGWQAVTDDTSDVVAMEHDGTAPIFLRSDGSLLNGLSGQSYFTRLTTLSTAVHAAVKSGQRLYLGTESAGIQYYDLGTHTWNSPAATPRTSIRDLFSSGQRLWYVTAGGGAGLYDESTSKNSLLVPSAGQPWSSLASSTLNTGAWFHDRVWLAQQGGGVLAYDPLTYTITSQSNGLPLNAAVKELQASANALWARLDDRSQATALGELYRYSETLSSWLPVGFGGLDIREIATRGDVVWARDKQGAVYQFAEDGRLLPTYFEGNFPQLAAVRQVERDRHGNLWMISQAGAVDVYSPTTHSWVNLGPVEHVNGMLVAPSTADRDEIYLATDGGVRHYSILATTIKDQGIELNDLRVKQVLNGGASLWALTETAQGASEVMWRPFENEGAAYWRTVLNGSLPAGFVDRVSRIALLKDEFWVLDVGGQLGYYDLAAHRWLAWCAGQNLRVQDIVLAESALWIVDDGGGVYSFDAGQLYDKCSPTLHLSGAYRQLAVTNNAIWQLTVTSNDLWQLTADQVLRVSPQVTAKGSTSTVFSLNAIEQADFDPAGFLTFVSLRAIYLVLWCGMPILLLMVLLKLISRSWRLSPYEDLISSGLRIAFVLIAIPWAVLGIQGFQGNWWPWREELTIAAQQGIDVRAIASYADEVWVATSQGIWRFQYDGANGRLIVRGHYTTDNGLLSNQVANLFVSGDVLYAQLTDGRTQSFGRNSIFESGWHPDQLPARDEVQLEREPWRWTLKDQRLLIELKDGRGQYRPMVLNTTGFTLEQPASIVAGRGAVWSVTPDGLAGYQVDADGALKLDRAYYRGEDGLPAAPIARCLGRETSISCEAGGGVYVLEANADHWQAFTGPSPFEETRTIYADAQTGLSIQDGPGGISFSPASLLDEEQGGFIYDHIEALAQVDDELWLKTPVGVWRSASGPPGLSLQSFHLLTPENARYFQGTRQETWTPPGDVWRWDKTHDVISGDETLRVTLAAQPEVQRIFEARGLFADQFVQAVAAEPEQAGLPQTIWLATQQGIWRAQYRPETNALQRMQFYPLRSESFDRLGYQADQLYAQSASGAVLRYDAPAGSWLPTAQAPFSQTTVLSADVLGALIRIDPQDVQVLQQDNGRGFRFDHLQAMAARAGSLWTATPAGVIEYHLSADRLQPVKRYTMADGLASENVISLEMDTGGTLYGITQDSIGQLTYEALLGDRWVEVDQANTPFRSDALVENLVGIAQWRRLASGQFQPELAGEPVRFVAGKLAFDRVYDLAVVNGDLWLLTAQGPLRYRDGEPPVFQQVAQADIPDEAWQDLALKDGTLFARSSDNQVYAWQAEQWQVQDAIAGAGVDDPFVKNTLRLANDRWQTVNRPDIDEPPLFQVQGISTTALFNHDGKFIFDVVRSLAAGNGQAWLGTQGGVLHDRVDQMPRLHHLDSFGLPALNVAAVDRAGDQVFARVEETIYARPVSEGVAWQTVPARGDLFQRLRLIFKAGQWQRQNLSPEQDVPLLKVDNAEDDYALFEAGGKFAFDVVHSAAVDGETIWLATQGGLVRARLAPDANTLEMQELITRKDGLIADEVDRVRMDGAGNLWLAQGNIHRLRPGLRNDAALDPFINQQVRFPWPDVSENVEVKAVPGFGLQIWVNAILAKEIVHTDRYLDALGRSDRLDTVVDILDDAQEIWVATPNTLAVVHKAALRPFIAPR